jgi:hypothetical protein
MTFQTLSRTGKRVDAGTFRRSVADKTTAETATKD